MVTPKRGGAFVLEVRRPTARRLKARRIKACWDASTRT